MYLSLKSLFTKVSIMVVVGLTLFACKEEQIPEPKLHYDMALLYKVVADMEFSEQLMAMNKQKKKAYLSNKLTKELEKIHDIEIEKVKADIEEIQKSPKHFYMLMDSVVSILNEKKKNM